MSADVWLEIDTGGSEPTRIDGTEHNVTYNLTPMLRAAGLPPHRDLDKAPASEAGGVYKSAADRLRAEPERFKRMNPENGWGTYEWALGFCDGMAEACASHPKATIGSWL